MVYGHVFPLSISRRYVDNEVMQGEKWMCVGSDGMVEMVFLYSIYFYTLSC